VTAEYRRASGIPCLTIAPLMPALTASRRQPVKIFSGIFAWG